jgi:hypothetical protein
MRLALAVVLALLAYFCAPDEIQAQTFSGASAAPSFTSPTEAQYNGAAYVSTNFTITANCNNVGDCFVRLTPPAQPSTPFSLLWKYVSATGGAGGCQSVLSTPSFTAITLGQIILTVKKNQSCTITLQFQTTLDPSTSWATLKVSGTPYIQGVGIRISNS